MSRIEIVPYDPRWPEEFCWIGRGLRDVLVDLALRIDHIGSTSVPDLPAKDIIDIQVTVASLQPAEPLVAALASAGYTVREGICRDHMPSGVDGPVAEWEKLFFAAPPEQRRTNLHVRVQDRANQRYALLFRDYLRTHPLALSGYAEVKRQLARHHPDDISAYLDVKDPVCDIIMAGAEAWAAATRWQPGPSDV